MRLSVIIPVYNVEQYLRECLDSVFSQDFKDFEVICVNDGSTDSSGEILAEYQAVQNNMITITQSNSGQSCARNSGLKKVTGDYIYFLDSDDYLLPGTLKLMMDFAVKKEVEIAGFNAATDDKPYYFPKGFNIEKCSGAEYLKTFYHNVGRYFNAPVWMYLYKTDFIRKYGISFIPGRLHEDNEFIARALYLSTSCAMYNKAVLLHRVNRQGSTMAEISVKSYAYRLMNFRDLFGFYTSRPLKSPFIEALICQFLSIFSESRRSKITFAQISLKISDLLKFALISPFYISVLFRRWKRYKWVVKDKRSANV